VLSVPSKRCFRTCEGALDSGTSEGF
jgi:hypothetical protein